METARAVFLDLAPPFENLIDYIDEVCGRFNIESLQPQIRACRNALGQEGTVNVAVVGRFKAGKSSFLNRLVGRELMPVDVVPATAVITQVTYGPRDRAMVTYLGGRVEEIDLDNLAEFVAEKHNPDNMKQVALVDVQLTSLEPYRGICFVDTPGLGSVHKHNTAVAMDWLPEIGAAIVAMSIDPPLSEDDVALLAALTRFTPEIVILLTKVDLAAEGQLEAVMAFMREQIAKNINRNFPIYPFSIKPGFDKSQQAVQQYLSDRIAGHKDEKYREILTYKLEGLIGECIEYMNLALAAAEAGGAARDELKRLLSDERGSLTEVRNEIHILAADLKKRSREKSSRSFRGLQQEVEGRTLAVFDEAKQVWRGHLGKTSREFTEWAEQAFTDELNRISPRGGEYLMGYLDEAETTFLRLVKAFQDRLAEGIQKALGLSFSGTQFEVVVEPPNRPDTLVDRPFDIPLNLLWFVIPMPVFRPLFYRRWRSQIPWQIEKNLSRLAIQWSDAVADCIDDIARQAREFVEQELSTVEGLVAVSGEDEIGATKDILQNLENAGVSLARAG